MCIGTSLDACDTKAQGTQTTPSGAAKSEPQLFGIGTRSEPRLLTGGKYGSMMTTVFTGNLCRGSIFPAASWILHVGRVFWPLIGCTSLCLGRDAEWSLWLPALGTKARTLTSPSLMLSVFVCAGAHHVVYPSMWNSWVIVCYYLPLPSARCPSSARRLRHWLSRSSVAEAACPWLCVTKASVCFQLITECAALNSRSYAWTSPTPMTFRCSSRCCARPMSAWHTSGHPVGRLVGHASGPCLPSWRTLLRRHCALTRHLLACRASRPLRQLGSAQQTCSTWSRSCRSGSFPCGVLSLAVRTLHLRSFGEWQTCWRRTSRTRQHGAHWKMFTFMHVCGDPAERNVQLFAPRQACVPVWQQTAMGRTNIPRGPLR